MKSREPRGDVSALKPAGVLFAAVVAGLGTSGHAAERAQEARPRAPLEPAGQAHTYVVDPTNHAGFEEDPDMIVGAGEPTAVFGEAKGETQRDLFKR